MQASLADYLIFIEYSTLVDMGLSKLTKYLYIFTWLDKVWNRDIKTLGVDQIIRYLHD